LILSIKVKTNSRANEIAIDADENVIVKIAAAPHDGQANEALITFLSKSFHVPKSTIKIISGLTNQYKRLEFPEEYAKEIHSAIKKYRNNK
jgi:uncharacterized protein (TIGR00251 family)